MGLLRWKIAQWAEIKWWQQYLKKKDKNEYLSWKRNYWTELLKKIKTPLFLNNNHQILDAGCGPAGVFMVFDKNPVTAIDPLLKKYTNIPHFSQKDYPNVTFKNLPLEDFKPSQKFDTVFCMNAINHVIDIEVCYDNLVTATQKGGYLVVTIDAHNHQFFKKLFRLFPGDVLHPHQYDLQEYEGFLTQRNCQVLETHLIKKEFFFNHYIMVAKCEDVRM